MIPRRLRLLKSSRGSILVHVLVTSILVTIIATGLMTFLMMQYKMADLASKMSQNKKKDELALAELISSWNSNASGASVCGSFGPYTCATGAGTVCASTCKAPETCTWTSGCNCRVLGAVTQWPTICVTDADASGIRKLKIVSSAP